MHDPMEDLLDVRDDIDRAAQRFERAAARRTDTEGSDPDGVVTVAVTAEGRLTAVRVRAGWEATVDAESLGGAVLAAVADAGANAARAWGAGLAEELDEPRPMTRPLPGVAGSLAEGLDGVTDRETLVRSEPATLEAMATLLEQMLGELDEVVEEVQQVGSRTVEGRAAGSDVVVTLSGAAAVTGVTIGPRAAERHAANISRLVMEAYADALAKVAEHGVEQVLDRSVFGELHRLSTDPLALADRLRAR